MRNRVAVLGLATLGLFGAACGAGVADESAATTTSSARPTAPDFTLQLGEGGSYTLSDSEKPVYLVFWAEW